jgi:hypothetical protein
MSDKKQFSNTKSIVKVETGIVTLISYHHFLKIVGNIKWIFQLSFCIFGHNLLFPTIFKKWWYEISVTIPVSTFTIDLVFENCFLSDMALYVYFRDGQSLSIYGSECQIWKTLLRCFPIVLLRLIQIRISPKRGKCSKIATCKQNVGQKEDFIHSNFQQRPEWFTPGGFLS